LGFPGKNIFFLKKANKKEKNEKMKINKKIKMKKILETWQECAEKGCRHTEELNWYFGQKWKANCTYT